MFGILTYLKIGVVAALLIVCGYYVWNYHHMQTKITALQQEIAAQKLTIEVIEKAQKATDEYIKTMDARIKRNVQYKAGVDAVVEKQDNPAMYRLWLERGMLSVPKTPSNSPPGGKTGSPRNLSP